MEPLGCQIAPACCCGGIAAPKARHLQGSLEDASEGAGAAAFAHGGFGGFSLSCSRIRTGGAEGAAGADAAGRSEATSGGSDVATPSFGEAIAPLL